MDAAERYHNSIVDKVEEELQNRGHSKNYKYMTYKEGEIDLFSVVSECKKYVLLFEIKGNYSPSGMNKAIEQTNRAERFYFDTKKYRVFKFFVYGQNGEAVYNWIKHNKN